MAGDPYFFLRKFFSSARSCEGVKKVGLFMFKIPDFSLEPCLCKQAGLDLKFLHEKISIPVHLYRKTFAIFAWLYSALSIAPEHLKFTFESIRHSGVMLEYIISRRFQD